MEGLILIREIKEKKPQIDNSVFIAPGSQIMGEVTIKKNASIWYNAVLRGDIGPITIGEMTNIQENSSLHIDYGYPLILGNKITVGHGAILHGCTINENCLIGMGSTILNDVVIGKNSIVGAGALVTEGTEIPPESLVVGVPGKVIRKLKKEETEKITKSAEEYFQLAQEHKKTHQTKN